MNTPRSPRPHLPTRARRLSTRRLHRLSGVVLGGPLLLLIITGLPLEFTGPLKLGEQGVTFGWVHDRYGIGVPAEASRSANTHVLGSMVFIDDRAIPATGQLIGARELEMATLVFLQDELLLVPRDREAGIERVALPEVRAVGETPDFEFVIDTAEQGLLLSSDLGASWFPGDVLGVTWLDAETVATPARIASRFGAAQISWERWLQDLHSGRFFGPVGVWIMSLAGIALILLAITGLAVWWRTRA